MRTLLLVIAGIVMALVFHLVGVALRRRGALPSFDGERLFIGVWLALASVDFWVGVEAGHAPALELGIHLLIFALPASLAWHLSRRHHRSPTAPQ